MFALVFDLPLGESFPNRLTITITDVIVIVIAGSWRESRSLRDHEMAPQRNCYYYYCIYNALVVIVYVSCGRTSKICR